jgi:hypothetical protein
MSTIEESRSVPRSGFLGQWNALIGPDARAAENRLLLAPDLPSLILMAIGLRDAGDEALRPRPEHALYGGIYRRIGHHQAAGEVFLWWAIACLLRWTFLVVFSFVYIPIFLIMRRAEEQDLLLRYGRTCAGYCRQTGAFLPRARDWRQTL